ncbi:uncharacterized protein [Populus alba]|uniref:uncharacterized protein isoform X1 n=2 Tax=Populus alba TaxID=43335 RepID=UPI00158EBF7F|nr:uncharacterized protein LOC118032341 [Populus alba]
MVGGGKKISAVSARARTRRNKARSSSFPLFPDMFTKAVIVLLISLLVWTYQTIIQPPPPNICGLPGGPPVTSPRIKLSDGRYLAYRERGVAKEKSEFKIIMVHGFDNSKDMALVASQELILELRIYFLSFDRAGYGESDPNPNRSVKSDTFDIQELADKLQLGSNFYVVGISMGGYPTWGCLKYIPNRLAGAALVVPIVNYWWPSFPCHLSREAYKRQLRRDQWKLRIAHYVPGLLYWWMSQKWFPSSSYVEIVPEVYGNRDKQILKMMSGTLTHNQTVIRQQGVFESLHRDLMVGFGSWDFDPMELSNPFPHNESFVHIWQGFEDPLVPVKLQQYVCRKLQWIRYHEVTDGGHLIMYDTNLFEAILRELLLPSGV